MPYNIFSSDLVLQPGTSNYLDRQVETVAEMYSLQQAGSHRLLALLWRGLGQSLDASIGDGLALD